MAPATWNRHAATVRSFLRYAARHRLLPELGVELDRRREPADRTRALPRAALERLWARRDVRARRKTLWRLLYETAARAGEALSLNVEDLDLANRRAVIRGKNGELDYLHWQTGTGHLLSRLIAGRTSGPLFLTDRRARRPARRRRSICARTPAGRGCPTAARRSASRGDGRVDAAPVAPLGAHAPGRGQRQHAAADGQESPHEPAVAAEVRAARRRRRRQADRRARSGAPPAVARDARRACAAVPAERSDASTGLRAVHARALARRARGLLLLQRR